VPSIATAVPAVIEPERLKLVMDAAERHFDKIDPCAFLELLPKSVPLVHIVNFVAISMESAAAKRHNLQVLVFVEAPSFFVLLVAVVEFR
jgi:hypothetical protein